MIRFSNGGDKAALKNIWQSGFFDDQNTVDTFFDKGENLFKCLVYADGEKPVAAMYIFDCTLNRGENGYKSAYLYALSTLPEYRGKGIMTSLIKYAEDYLGEKGYDYLFLAPSENSLCKYYEKLGFLPCDMKKCADIPADCIFDMPTETKALSAAEFYELRGSSFADYVGFDKTILGFMLDFGEAEVISFDGGWAVVDGDGETIRVIEFFGEINRTLSAVKSLYKSKKYRVYLENGALMGETVCRGMVKSLGDKAAQKDIHIGLIMD